MKGDPEDKGPIASRRDLLRGAGLAGAVAATGGAAQAQTGALRREALELLTVAEADALDAFCARLIPSDANGPGATEARAANYIDRALGGALTASRETYRSGLTALDARAVAAQGKPFARLTPALQDALLTELEAGKVEGAPPGFFPLVRGHTLQGTFGDPYYGGNANFVGWDMIGYPGLRMAVGSRQQAMDPKLKPTHVSAYDLSQFNRAGGTASLYTPVKGPAADMKDMPGMAKDGGHDH